MATLTVDGRGEFEVPAGKRLVLALEDEAGLDQLHACGGVGKCTTCQVTVLGGEPTVMTRQERETLQVRGLIDTPDLRLSCQMTMQGDLTVRAESLLSGSSRKDAGPRPAEQVEPAE